MIARIRYKDLENVSPFSEEYANKISERKAELKELFKDEPEKRLAEIKSQSQAQITQAKQELETALAQTQQMATSNPAEAASVKEATTKIEAKQKNSKKVKQWLIIYQRLAINSTLVERFRVLRDMLLMKVILTSFTM